MLNWAFRHLGFGSRAQISTGGGGGGGGATPPVVSSDSATGVGQHSATLNGTLSDLGEASSVDCYFEYRQQGTSTWSSTSAQNKTSTGSFSDTISGLSLNTTYEWRAVADASDGESDTGSILTFTTDLLPLSDSFSDSNGTRLFSHPMDEGLGWSDNGLEIQSNQAKSVAGVGDDRKAITEAGAANITTSFTLSVSTTSQAGEAGNIVRAQDLNNLWFHVYGTDNGRHEIWEFIGGGYTVRASENLTPVIGSATMTFQASGTTLTGTIPALGGNISYSSSLYSGETHVGFGLTNKNVTSGDDFSAN